MVLKIKKKHFTDLFVCIVAVLFCLFWVFLVGFYFILFYFIFLCLFLLGGVIVFKFVGVFF